MADMLVLSDTHLDDPDLLPDELLCRAADCDLIIHCGDIGSIRIIEKLSSIKSTIHVRGNCDISPEFDMSPEKFLFVSEGRKIAIAHGWGKITSPANLLPLFHPTMPDILLFGHTHRRFAREIEGVYYLNPGSATRPKDGEPSCAVLSVTRDDIAIEFLQL